MPNIWIWVLWRKISMPLHLGFILWLTITLFISLPLLYAAAVLFSLPFLWFILHASCYAYEMFLYRYLDSLTCNLHSWSVLAKWLGGGFGGVICACIYGTSLSFFVGAFIGGFCCLITVYKIYGFTAFCLASK